MGHFPWLLNNQMVKKQIHRKKHMFQSKKKRLEKNTHTHISPKQIPRYPKLSFFVFSKPIPNYKSQEKKLSHKFPTKTDGKLVNSSLHYGWPRWPYLGVRFLSKWVKQPRVVEDPQNN